jgi:beta-barrel assembly-enhancing protease
LLVDGDERARIPVDAIDVSVGGFDDNMLVLCWSRDGAICSVVLAEIDAQKQLLALAPASLLPKLQRGHGDANYHRRKWQAVIGILAAFAVTMCLAIWQRDAVVGWVASRVPVEKEERLGRMMLAQLEAEGNLIDKGVAVDTVKSIGDRLTAGSRYKYEWRVQRNNAVNAFAAPGGLVVVTSGLIAKTLSAEELAGVLAHEVQHVELRHSLKQMIHSAGWAAILAVTLGDVSAVSAVLIHQAGSLSHGRELEREADDGGISTLVRTGISADGLHHFFEALLAEEKKVGGSGIAMLSTHPATAERIANIEQKIKSAHCDCKPLAYDWTAVKASVAPRE